MSHRHRLLQQCRNTALPFGLFCLLGYFASWAALPLGLYIDILPLGLCLIDTVCFDNAGILLCLLGYFASWAALPLGLLYILGYISTFASWAKSHWHCLLWQCRYTAMPLGLFCLLGCFASWATLPLWLYIDILPLGLCLIDTVCFDNAGILLCLLGCANTRHLLVCKMISNICKRMDRGPQFTRGVSP
jgi:hypothetical protein